MRIYIAAGLHQATLANAAAQFVRRSGCAVTSEWTGSYDAIRKGLAAGRTRIEIIAADAVHGAQQCDAMIVLLPGGSGTHIELGIALGLRKPVAIIGDLDPFVTFYMHPSVVYRAVGTNLESAISRALPRLTNAHYMVRSNHG